MEIRRKYWIIKGCSLVRLIIHHCVTRKRHEGAPFRTPALPAFQIQEEPPFTFTGVDYAGPLYTRSREASKIWIYLFTCCVTCAIHPELVTDMSTECFIRCLKQFVEECQKKKSYQTTGRVSRWQQSFWSLQESWSSLHLGDRMVVQHREGTLVGWCLWNWSRVQSAVSESLLVRPWTSYTQL